MCKNLVKKVAKKIDTYMQRNDKVQNATFSNIYRSNFFFKYIRHTLVSTVRLIGCTISITIFVEIALLILIIFLYLKIEYG